MKTFKIKILGSSLLTVSLMLQACASKDAQPEEQTTASQAAAVQATPTPEPVSRQRTDPAPKADVTCKKNDDTRVLEISEVRGGCWMMYVNKGIKKRAAWSKKGNSHCEKVRDQIRGTLIKSGYTCS